jgi:hypothetical protein
VVNARGTAAAIVATGGTPQSTTLRTPFSAPLEATVRDAFGNGVPGVVVTFTAPASGPSGTFAGGGATAQATTSSTGAATSPVFTASQTAGSYQVSAAAPSVDSPALFSLSNDTTATNVPALEGWGLLALISTLAGCGVWFARRG